MLPLLALELSTAVLTAHLSIWSCLGSLREYIPYVPKKEEGRGRHALQVAEIVRQTVDRLSQGEYIDIFGEALATARESV